MKWIQLENLCAAAIAGVALFGCDATPSAPSASSPAPTEVQLQALRSSIETALAVPDPYQRVHQIASVLQGVAPGTSPELKRALEIGSRTGMGVAEYELLIRAWAAQDPEAASNWVLEPPGSHLRVTAIEAAVEAWARSDPRAAVAGVTWAAQIGDREVAQAVQQGLVRGWFDVDRPALEKYIDDLGTGIEQQRSMLFYAFALQRAEGSDALMRWATEIPEERDAFKRVMYRQISTALAWADPPAAERWCDAQCEGPYGKSLRSAIVRVRLQNSEDGAGIMEWIGHTPESESQLQALRIGYQLWAIKEPATARRWLEGKIAAGPEPWIKRLYGAYARQLAPTQPVEAMHWAEQVDNEKLRNELMVRIARRWRRDDQAAADAWLEKSSLSEKDRVRAQDLTQPDYIPDLPSDDAGDDAEPAA